MSCLFSCLYCKSQKLTDNSCLSVVHALKGVIFIVVIWVSSSRPSVGWCEISRHCNSDWCLFTQSEVSTTGKFLVHGLRHGTPCFGRAPFVLDSFHMICFAVLTRCSSRVFFLPPTHYIYSLKCTHYSKRLYVNSSIVPPDFHLRSAFSSVPICRV